jgi:hypothetical protein
LASALLLEKQFLDPAVMRGLSVFRQVRCGGGAQQQHADAEAASITMLLRKKQFDFGYHNKMHRNSREVVRIRLSGSNA